MLDLGPDVYLKCLIFWTLLLDYVGIFDRFSETASQLETL
jgi:hypothetical protein